MRDLTSEEILFLESEAEKARAAINAIEARAKNEGRTLTLEEEHLRLQLWRIVARGLIPAALKAIKQSKNKSKAAKRRGGALSVVGARDVNLEKMA